MNQPPGAGRRRPTPAWLREQYVRRQRSASELAVATGWSSQYIRDRLRDAGVELRPTGTRGIKKVPLDRPALEALLGRGLSVAAIAERAGYGCSGVYKLLRQYGLPNPGRPPVAAASDVVIADCGRLYRQRLSLIAIGARYDRGPDWARTRVEAAGVPIRLATHTTRVPDVDTLQAAVDGGATVADLAARFDRSRDTIWDWLRRAGIQPAPAPPRARVRLPDAEQLRRLYVDERLTIAEVAARLGVPRHRVQSGLAAAGIAAGRGRRSTITATTLQQLYVDQELSASEGAARLGLSETPVLAALRRHGIAVRPPRRVPVPELVVDAVTLRRLYVDERLSDKDIATRLGVPAYRVRSRREALGVTRARVPPPHPAPAAAPDRDRLRQLYLERGLTLVDIARAHHTSSPTVAQWLRAAGIPVRERTQRSHRRRLDPDQLRELYLDREWTAAEIGAELDATIHLVLRNLHDNGIPVRRGGSRRRVQAPGDGAERVLDALYDDTDIQHWLREHHVPECRERGPIGQRFPQPVPLTPVMLYDAYDDIGLSARNIELLTGQPAEQILAALREAGIEVRSPGPSPWRRRRGR